MPLIVPDDLYAEPKLLDYTIDGKDKAEISIHRLDAM